MSVVVITGTHQMNKNFERSLNAQILTTVCVVAFIAGCGSGDGGKIFGSDGSGAGLSGSPGPAGSAPALGAAAAFGIAATAGVTNTATAPNTTINGIVILDPVAGARGNSVSVDVTGGF